MTAISGFWWCPHPGAPGYDPNPTIIGAVLGDGGDAAYARYAEQLDDWHPRWWEDDLMRMDPGLRAEAERRLAAATTQDGEPC